MAVEYLGSGNADGVVLGRNAADLVAFHGATPTDQYTLTSALATTTAVKTTGALTYGFSTSAKGNALIALVNSMRAALVEKGIGV